MILAFGISLFVYALVHCLPNKVDGYLLARKASCLKYREQGMAGCLGCAMRDTCTAVRIP